MRKTKHLPSSYNCRKVTGGYISAFDVCRVRMREEHDFACVQL